MKVKEHSKKRLNIKRKNLTLKQMKFIKLKYMANDLNWHPQKFFLKVANMKFGCTKYFFKYFINYKIFYCL